jgi:hypothetical protein
MSRKSAKKVVVLEKGEKGRAIVQTNWVTLLLFLLAPSFCLPAYVFAIP